MLRKAIYRRREATKRDLSAPSLLCPTISAPLPPQVPVWPIERYRPMRSSKHLKSRVLATLAGVALVTAMAACSSTPATTSAPTGATTEPTTSESAGGGPYTFGFTEWIAADFFDSVHEGLMSVVDEHGDTVIRAEGRADSEYQLSVIENFIAQDVDLVFYNPVDTAASQVAVDKLKEAGIPIVNFDAKVANLDDVEAFVATNNEQAGVQAGEAMLKDFPNGGEVAVLNYPANTAAVDRETGFLKAIEGSNLTVVQTLDGKGLTEDSTNQTEDILQAHPNLAAVFGINDDSGLGAYAAITAAGKEVKIYAVNGSPAAKEKVAEKGIFAVTVAQSTINMGKQSAEVAYKILAGEEFEPVILIDPITISAENIDQYGTEGWQ